VYAGAQLRIRTGLEATKLERNYVGPDVELVVCRVVDRRALAELGRSLVDRKANHDGRLEFFA
jgi:hypothetical protein